jgi:hypothetical protein
METSVISGIGVYSMMFLWTDRLTPTAQAVAVEVGHGAAAAEAGGMSLQGGKGRSSELKGSALLVRGAYSLT